MSSLIDIWTLERERMVRSRTTAVQVFRSVASRDGSAQQARTARSSADKSCDDGAMVTTAETEKQGAAGSPPVSVQEDTFLSVLVDCFGQ
ncbi:hypothetical protein ACP70R_025500 [Stipagrostis hirtigluma subsp. patula]